MCVVAAIHSHWCRLCCCLCFSVPEQKNPLLLLKQSGVGTGLGRVKRRYKRKNAGSPAKKGPSPVKRRQTASSPAKAVKSRELTAIGKVSQRRVGRHGRKRLFHSARFDVFASVYLSQLENGPSTSTSKPETEVLSTFTPRPAPALAGACDLTDIRTLLKEWVTTITGMNEWLNEWVLYFDHVINFSKNGRCRWVSKQLVLFSRFCLAAIHEFILSIELAHWLIPSLIER